MFALLICIRPWIIDGDTLVCNHQHVRFTNINAPELNTPEGIASRNYLISITRTTVTCTPTGYDKYKRTLATCSTTQDLEKSLVRNHHAKFWLP